MKFECRWVHLQTQETACPWLVPGEVWPVPVAHAEGRFAVRDEATLASLYERGQVALKYVTSDGGVPAYPEDPNGAVDHIAGVCDPTGRVLGLMPHPERNLTPWNHPRWTRQGRIPRTGDSRTRAAWRRWRGCWGSSGPAWSAVRRSAPRQRPG